ncbi:MAG: glycerophosphodiester phosphodiesterase [Spirochaetaceae bacterium]
MYNKYEFFNNSIKVTAHRGDSKYFPENSMQAFQSAVDLGVDVIETDVHISSDGVVFVWHDDNSFKLDGNTANIATRSWSELKDLDLGFLFVDNDGKRPFSSQGIRLMKFIDVLKIFPKTRFNVDLKDKNSKLVTGMFNILKEENAFNRVVVASFHTENLKAIRRMSNKVATSYGRSEVRLRVILSNIGLLRAASRFLGRSPVMQVPVISGSTTVITKYFIKVLHKRGIKVQVWTINEEDEMRRLYKMGVDGVMTDDPRLLLSVVQNP